MTAAWNSIHNVPTASSGGLCADIREQRRHDAAEDEKRSICHLVAEAET
jgi:hypothetical protein